MNIRLSGLLVVKVRVKPTPLQERRVCPHLHHPPVLQRDDLVSSHDGRKPVGDQNDGAIMRDADNRLLDQCLRLIVQRARRLVEDEELRVSD